MTARPVIIGAGHNGLTVAFYLARAGLRPVVLERREQVGGAAVNARIGSGFLCPELAHAIGPLRPSVIRDMALERRGVEFLQPDPCLLSLSGSGPHLVLSRDPDRTAAAVRAVSGPDARRYPEFCATLRRLSAFLQPVLERTPPSLELDSMRDLREVGRIGLSLRALSREDGYRLLRWGPMPVADAASEWFESGLMQAAVAARGIFGVAAGPRSAGTTAVMLLSAAADPQPGGSSVTVKGGLGALTRAMADAARGAGAEIRTHAPVTRILSGGGVAEGVALEGGEEVRGTAVISSVDPSRTLLDLLEPGMLDPRLRLRARNYRGRGVTAKVNLALGGLPAFTGVGDRALLAGRIQVGPDIDYLERAFDRSKYGQISEEPYLDIAIPTMSDPSLAPPGKHVMSICVQYAPYRLAGGAGWDEQREALAACVMSVLDRHAPGIGGLVEARQVLTPLDLERTWGLTGGHIHHGEPALDQLFAMRPFPGAAQYRTPVPGLFLCGAGTHPGGGLTAGSGQNAAREILADLQRLARRGRE